MRILLFFCFQLVTRIGIAHPEKGGQPRLWEDGRLIGHYPPATLQMIRHLDLQSKTTIIHIASIAVQSIVARFWTLVKNGSSQASVDGPGLNGLTGGGHSDKDVLSLSSASRSVDFTGVV